MSNTVAKEESELLGVSVGYLETVFVKAVENVFGTGVNPNFYQINAAMLLGDAPREVEIWVLSASICKVGDIVKQLIGKDDWVQACVKRVNPNSLVVIETGTVYNPNKQFKDGKALVLQGLELNLGVPSKLNRCILNGWPLGKGLKCPRDGELDCSLVDALFAKGPQGSVKKADVYLSWAWKYKLSTVVDGLLGWCQKNGRDKNQTFVWICAFNNNQYRVQQAKEANILVPFQDFKRIFETRIRKIDLVLSLLDSWARPEYIRRLWCDLELAVALSLKIKVDIALPTVEEGSFLNALLSGTDTALCKVWTTLGSIQVEKGEATCPQDANNILAFIRGTEGGTAAVNEMVKNYMQGWLVSTVNQEANSSEIAKKHAALLLSKFGSFYNALKLRKEVLEFRERVLPGDHPHIAEAKSNLASSYEDLGQHGEALKMRKEVLEFRERVLPGDHPPIADAKGNLANSYAHLGQHSEALKLQREVLEFRERVLPGDHPDIASAKSNLANSYAHLGQHVEALKMRKEVLEFRERVLPGDHPDIAEAKENLANSYAHLGQHGEALAI